MLYLVKMSVALPYGMVEEEVAALKAKERAASQVLQKSGVWKHLWRVAGAYANVSVFEVQSPEQLHEVLTSLPFFPFLSTEVTALVPHPSAFPVA
jgi:muconolactone D-isomerase